MVRLFQTGDSTGTDLINVGLELTDNVWLKAALLKALSLMCNPENWTQMGLADVDFARDKSNEMYESIEFDMVIKGLVPVGGVMIWHMASPPAGWLICDGSAKFVTDYPELFAIWGYKYGGAGTQFALPDTEDLIPIGAGGFVDLDEMGGAGTHTLTIAEMPSHNHSDAIRVGSGSPARSVVSSGGATLVNINAATVFTGQGLPHNNMPPVRGVNFIVWPGIIPP